MILPNNTGGVLLQTMLYLANQQNNYSDLYNLPAGINPAGEWWILEIDIYEKVP